MPTTTNPALRARPTRARRSAVALVAITSLVCAAVEVPNPLVRLPRAVAAPAAPTGSLALAGGVGGAVDPETGQLTTVVPLADIRGRGDADVQLALTWQQSRAAQTVNRSGWGAGWSLGTPFVNVAGIKRVYTASAGSYLLDGNAPSGLKNYKPRDITFTSSTTTVPAACAGPPAASYNYAISYDDGRIDCFDANGNLAARLDRFGNRTQLTWRARAGGIWQPTSVTDSFGLVTTFDYSTVNEVKVISPRRSDNLVSTTVITVNPTLGVQSYIDPVGQTTTFKYASVSGSPTSLLTGISTPTGAQSQIAYQAPSFEPGLLAVSSVRMTNVNGDPVSPVQTFSLDPTGNNRHNYSGYPNHLGTDGDDALFESGDSTYTYTTALTTGATTTLSTYDALHRMIKRVVQIAPGGGQSAVTTETQQIAYGSPVIKPAGLSANYARPVKVSLTESAASSVAGVIATAPRTTSTSTQYDDHGRIVSATDALGATTVTDYDNRFGQVIKQTTTGADGSEAQEVDTLTDDGRNVASSTTAVGQSGHPLSARNTISYTYDATGEVDQRRLAWAPGAKPAGPTGGPDVVVTDFSRTFDVPAATETLSIVTAYGTPAAETTTSAVDLVTDEAVSEKDAKGRITTAVYDALGRQTKLVAPGGYTTTTSYSATQTTVTSPNGKMTRTVDDLLGRTVSVTDNVQDGALTSNPAARALSTTSYSPDGNSTTTTDQDGRRTVTTLDATGRQVSKIGPTGLTYLTSYDDGAAHTERTALVPSGGTQPVMNTSTGYDDGNRAVDSRTTYPIPTVPGGRPGPFLADPTTSAAFDGLGQPATTTSDDLAVSTDNTGVGGVPTSTTATPDDTTNFPGPAITAITVRDLTGAATSRTLQQGDTVSKAVAVVYNADGEVVTATDPDGHVTAYTYEADGQPHTQTDPSGAVTTFSYDPVSGLESGVAVTAPGKATRTYAYTRVPPGQPGAAQIRTISDGNGTITYGYDADGHRTSVGYPDGTSTSSTYDEAGLLTSTTDVTGAVTRYTYDPTTGVLVTAKQTRGNAVLASVTYAYDSLSRVSSVTRGNGTKSQYTYTPGNDLASESTTTAAGDEIESHSYTYDTHHNLASRSDLYLRSSGVFTPGAKIWTTLYKYDAYDRLVSSAVYSGALVGGRPSGPLSTSTTYTLDLAGNVAKSVTARRTPGPRPIVTTTTTTSTIDPAGLLTRQQVGTVTSTATYDGDGRVLTSVHGDTTTYGADGAPATRTSGGGTTTTYAMWPDGTRRSAVTTTPDGHTSAVTYHYGTDGNLTNDSTSDTSTGTGMAATASYLLTTAREARTLLPGTALTGKVIGTPAAPIDTGTGVGYYLRDRHTSVSALVDASGAVTANYGYTDYGGAATGNGQPTTLPDLAGGRTNPFTYLGTALRAPLTDVSSGLDTFTDRDYDPALGRFTSADPVDAHNRYQAFNTNPIRYLDLSGGISAMDIALDSIFAVMFVVTAVLTAGAAAAAAGAIAAAVAADVAVTAGAAINLGATVLGTVANLTGAITSSWLAADDIDQKAYGKTLMTPDLRERVTMVNGIATAVAGGTGIVQGLTDGAITALKAATTAAGATVATTGPTAATVTEEVINNGENLGDGENAGRNPGTDNHVEVPDRTDPVNRGGEAALGQDGGAANQEIIENGGGGNNAANLENGGNNAANLENGGNANGGGDDQNLGPVQPIQINGQTALGPLVTIEPGGPGQLPVALILPDPNPQVLATDAQAMNGDQAVLPTLNLAGNAGREVEHLIGAEPLPTRTLELVDPAATAAQPSDDLGNRPRSASAFTNTNVILVKNTLRPRARSQGE